MTRRVWLIALMSFWVTVLNPAAAGADTAAGKATFEGFCVNCHGPLGKGDGPAGIDILPAPRDFTVGEFKFDADADGTPGTDADLALVIRDGASVYGGNPLMAPWRQLPEKDIHDVIAYIRTLSKSESAAP
jgi:mono/diheme cytochrome c family protein